MKSTTAKKDKESSGKGKESGAGSGTERKTALAKLFEAQLADILFAEKALTKALPKMAKAAASEELREAFESHLTETEGQIERLNKVFKLLGKTARAKECKAIEGLIEEGDEIAEEFGDTEAIDAGLIMAGQKVEHYEIGTYGTLVAWADELGLEEVSALLTETLEEEKAADEKLSEIATESANATADAAA